jgi:uncharacterized protein (TIGR02284 family)
MRTLGTALDLDDHGPMILALNRCVATCVDGEEVYELAAARVCDPALAALLLRYAGERLGFTFALEALIAKLGGIVDVAVTVSFGARSWMPDGMRADRAALDACSRSDRAALVVYQTAISRTIADAADLSPVRAVLETHYGEIQDALCEIERRLRAH